MHISEDVCLSVPHRQFVFTIPKRLRIYFRYDRDLLKELPKLAWQVIIEVYQAVLQRDDISPGMIAAVQTHGELAHFHPHVHALITNGAFASDGTFCESRDSGAWKSRARIPPLARPLHPRWRSARAPARSRA